LDYLSHRKLNINIVRKYCPEIYYTSGARKYFAIGFENDSGGYELRNRYFKGCTSKDVTTICSGSQSCLVFEGFIDFLSYLTFQNSMYVQESVIVLNSTSNLKKAIPIVTNYQTVNAFLDNDKAGKEALNILQSFCKSLNDKSDLYFPYKDFNEFL
jgi:hypothetical protein